jgi:putative DNA primase/helicase
MASYQDREFGLQERTQEEDATMAASSAPFITEDSAALAFARKYAEQFLYDHDAGAWFSWSGYHWRRETTRLAYEWARCLVRHQTEGATVKVQAKSRKTSP